jgi:peptidoglycan/LPS O-acetylase OafA/YrhL
MGRWASFAMTAAAQETDWQSLALLRFFLAWVVLSGHLQVFTTRRASWVDFFAAFGGKAAVIGFLLVSGYSIAASLERSARGFYRRRFLRIYPPYIFALAFATILQFGASDLARAKLPALTRGGEGWPTLLGNAFLLQTFVVKPLAFDGPVWSLAVEAFFYLLAPLLVRLRPLHLMALVVFSAVCYALPVHAEWGFAYRVLSRLNALHFMWCWLLGFLLRSHPTRPVAVLALLGVGAIIAGHDTLGGRLCVLTYLISLGVIVAATRVRMRAGWRRIADYLGDLSYPLYLMHFPSFILVLLYFGPAAHTAIPLLATAVGTTVVVHHVVEGYLKPRVLVPMVLGDAPPAPAQARVA